MKYNKLHPKMVLCSVLLILLLCVVGMTNAFAASQYDFSSVAPSGQTLYYKIISNTSTSRTVKVTHPSRSTDIPWGATYWISNNNPSGGLNIGDQGYVPPIGDLTIPYFVEYNGYSYSVIMIDDFAFGTTYWHNYNNGTIGYYSCNELTSVIIPSSVVTIGNQAFARCRDLRSITIPSSVSSLGSEVFRYCNNLVTVNFNATNCSSVGNNTWNGCTSFNTLNLGNTVTRIPDNGFQGATALASVTLPKKVASIGNYGFDGCTSLTNVTINNSSTLATIGCYAFQNCSQLASINLPNTLESIGNYAFNGCSLLQSTTESQLLPNALETIGDYAFQNASTLDYVRIPSSVTSIGKYAFKSCTALNTVDFEATNCTTAGTQAEPPFFYCSSLATVAMSDNVTQIPAYCFKDCTSLTNLTLRNGLTEVSDYAFYGCININSLILPVSVTNIGSFAFGNAYDMQIACVESYNPTPPIIGEEAVFPTGQTIYVPVASVSAYEIADYSWEDYFIEGMAYISIPAHGETDGWNFIASPLTATTAPTNIDDMIAETEINFDFYRFNQSAEMEWENWKSHANNDDHYHFNLVNGQGYLYANADDVNLVFKGEFNEDDTKNVELVYDANAYFAGWNLVGNPFPVNAYANKSYYTMNEDGAAIEPVAVSMETAIPPCTGIMVRAEMTGQSVTFTKESRQVSNNNGTLQIAVAQTNTRSNAVQDKTIISFNEEDQLEKFVFNKDNAKLYIPQGNADYAIAYAEKQGEMPLNFEAKESGSYTISVNPESVEMNYLHLIDNMTGTDIDLLATPSYTFESKTSDYASRFRLVFSASGNTNNEDEETFAFVSNGNIIVTGEYANATLQIVDMLGHVVVNTDVAHNVSTNGLASGVYVLRLINGNDVKKQKIVVR